MCGPFIVLGLVLPIAEILILVELSAYLGFLSTIGMVTLTALMGLHFVRVQGLSMLQDLRRGTIPQDADLLGGPLLVVAAVALLIPGIITDTLGFMLLVPPVRRGVAHSISRRMKRATPQRSTHAKIIVIRADDDDDAQPPGTDHAPRW
ncbi:MAG: FxsA family protein [Myxococcota bacterium]|nr:FxsA family protein [Myxococcota bacterium]